MKKNRGISLVTLIITIIVLVIVASVIIFTGLNVNREKAVGTKTVYEVYSIVDAVTNRALLNKLNPDYYAYVGINDFATIRVGNSETYTGGSDWYLVSSQEEFNELGLDNIDGEYLVNYKTGTVIAISGVKYEGTTYYSLNELKIKMGGGSLLLSSSEFDKEKKVNKPILSNGMVPVKLSGGSWVVADTEDNDWYDYSSEQMAWANVMLKDELTVSDSIKTYTNEEVREMSVSELVGKKVETEGSSYVWIPRYTAKSLGETGSEIVFSNLTDDTLTDGYTLPSAFTYTDQNSGSIQLPGIWVSKYEAGFDR